VLDRDNRVHLRNMTIARGFGTSVERRQGPMWETAAA
jgi:hypothetical protein